MGMKQIAPVIVSLETARRLTDAAIQKVADVGIPYAITVVDGSGNIVLTTRMDGAAVAATESSIGKARAAAVFGMSTKELGEAAVNGGPLATMQTGLSFPVTFVAGGVPIKDTQGVVIAAIGSGGALPEQDHMVSEFAASLTV
jgi:uncharacterized protein GlcG (DUF336 family)